MFNIRIADIIVNIDNKYDYVKNICKDYIVDDSAAVDIAVEISEKLIDEELNRATSGVSRGYAEGICV